MDVEARKRIERLEQEVARLRAEVRGLSGAPVPQQAQSAPRPAPQPAAQPTPQPATTPAQQPQQTPWPEADPGLEARIGTRWLAVAGIVLFVVAAGLFLRLAVVNGWIGPTAQIMLGIVLGIGVWVFGAFLDRGRKLGEFAHVLAGGGVAITAFAVYAAHHFPSYRAALGIGLGAPPALLALVAVGALVDAVARRAQAQAVIASLLGPVTALLALDLTAFSLLLAVLLAFALLAAATVRRWPATTLLAAVGAFVTVFVHVAVGVEPGAALGASVALLVGFTAVGFRARGGGDDQASAMMLGQTFAWLATWLVGVWALDQWAWDVDVAWAWTLLLGVAAGALALVPGSDRVVRWTWSGLAVAGVVGFVALVPEQRVVSLLWAAELGLVAVVRGASRFGRGKATTATAAVLLGLLALRTWTFEAPHVAQEATGWAMDAAVLALSAVAAATVWAVDWRTRGDDAVLARAHLGGAVAQTMVLAAVVGSGPGISLVWGLLAIALVAVGFAVKRGDLRVAGLGAFALTLGRIVVQDLRGVDPIWRVAAFAGVGVLLLMASWLYVRWARAEARPGPPAPQR